jgi:alpha-glucosidase
MSTAEKTDELILHVYEGGGSSEFTFYQDDGETFGYQSGEFCKRRIEYHGNENKLIITPSEGSFKEYFTKLRFIFHGLSADEITVQGERKNLEQFHHSFFSPLEKYDPINDPDSMGEEWVKSIQVAYTSDKIEVSW